MKKKGDLILVIGILLLAVIIWLLLRYVPAAEAAEVLVKQDGQIIGEYHLDQEQRISVSDPQGGYNIIIISEQSVAITDSDCPDKLCVRHNSITRQGESIICLPHKLIVQIISGKESDLDGITY